jgi:glycerophosphoryl diester phosphodiesterase
MKPQPLKILISLIVATIILVLVINPKARSHPYYAHLDHPLVIAHQGGDGVWPGDTMYAFENAVNIGVDVLEMDAHITKDGEIVLMHDEKVDRTTNGTGLIEDLTLAELKNLDAAYQWSKDNGKTFPYRGLGIQVPTLRELFHRFPQMRYVIEIKLTKSQIEIPLCKLIRSYKMQGNVLIASFHDTAMQNFRRACPEVATSASKGEVTEFVLLSKVFLHGLMAPGFEAIQPPYDPAESLGIQIMTQRFIEQAHSKNIKVEPWTVDDPELMKKYIEWGVDGIMTDRPDIMMNLLRNQ